MRILILISVIVFAVVYAFPFTAQTASLNNQHISGQSTASPPKGNIFGDFYFKGDILGYLYFQDLETSGVNSNNILGLSQTLLETVLRPDFYWTLDRIELEFKPRAHFYLERWEDGFFEQKEDEKEEDAFVNEWLARIRISDKFFVSGGRENLQWGPAYLLSPSNPFYQDNGRDNPSLELPGLDYIRGVFLPNSKCTFSLIANIGEGRLRNISEFQNTYAAKLDFTGVEKYFSFIGSYREHGKGQAGFFGGITLSDPLLAYAEGSYFRETRTMDFLMGGTYTFMNGAFISLEYYHHGSGCSNGSTSDCIASHEIFQEYTDRFIGFKGSFQELLEAIESLDIDLEMVPFIRKNYALIQYSKPRINGVLSLTVRYIYNIDDSSSRITGFANWELNDRFELFTIGNLFTGGNDTEFGSLLNHSLMGGIIFNY